MSSGIIETGIYSLDGAHKTLYHEGAYYSGKISGDPKSVVSFSFFSSNCMGFVSQPAEKGNVIIARLGKELTGSMEVYVIYNDKNLLQSATIPCHTSDPARISRELNHTITQRILQGTPGCVHLYFECDYQMFLDNGSDTTTVYNLVSALFNQVQQIYQLENISVVLSSMYVWTVNDPYDGLTTSNDYLTTFQTIRPVFNGDLAHLLTTHSTSVGGIAWLDVLCNPSYAYAFSPIDNSFANFPVYSQSVKAIAHEIGHNLGSNHTQWCGWTGGALDNCSPPEGSCLPGPVPINGGTIMSYCEQTVSGVNFSNGFGVQPGDVIRSRVNSASCLSSCNCSPDVTIFVSPSASVCAGTSVTFTANPVNGGTAPAYLWKINGIPVSSGSNSYSTATLTNGDTVTCEMQSNDLCALGITKVSNAIIMSVSNTSTPLIVIHTDNLSICQGETTQFDADYFNEGSAPLFSWKVNNIPVGVDSNVFISSTLNNNDIVTCELTSNLSCASPSVVTSNALTMSISATLVPSILISTPSSVICQSTTVTYSAQPLNGGSAPSYQWQVNGVDSGLNSPYFTVSGLADGDVVQCILTSNNTCANPTTAVSNSIAMTVNNSSVLPVNGLLAWYPFNGNANDNSGNNFNGTASGARLTRDRFSDRDNAYTFNGARDHIQIGSSSLLNNFSTGLTVSAWVYLGANNSSQASIVSKWKFNQTDDQYLLWLYNKKPNFATSNPLHPASGIQSQHVLIDSTWYFIVGTWDNTGLHSIYINGVLDVSAILPNFTTINNTSITDLRIGTEDSTYRAFKGKIDDVRIYNRVLNSQEIALLWNEGSTASVSITATAATICEGHSITFEASPLVGGQNPLFQWKINGNNVGPNNRFFSTNSLNNGDVVSCYMTSSDPCSQPIARSNSIPVTVIPEIQQSVTITADNNPSCPGLPVNFHAQPNNGSLGSSYRWKINGVDAGNSSDIFTSVVNDGDSISCEMISLFPCATPSVAVSNSILMQVENSGPAVVNISSPTLSYCAGDTVVISSISPNGGNSPQYEWYINGQLVSGNSSTYVSTSLSDQDSIRCILTSSSACAVPAIAWSNDLVLQIHPRVTPEVSLSALSTIICSNEEFNCTPVAVYEGDAPVFTWFVNGNFAGQSNGAYSFDQLNNFDEIFCLLNSNEYCAQPTTVSSDTLMIEVHEVNRPEITEQSGILSSTEAVNYQWYYNAAPITGATEQNLTALANGYYQVEITDSNGCTAISDVYADTTVGIAEMNSDHGGISIYPNPTSQDAVLILPGQAYIQVDLMSAEGKLLTRMYDSKSTEIKQMIPLRLTDLASGIYLLKIVRDLRIYYRKIILNHS